MLMDEPFAAVDPIVRERLQNEFLRLQDDLAKTILFVTHDIDEAIKMGDLVAVLQVGGELAQFGTPAEILAHPATDFVAKFVGADRGLKRLSLYRVEDVPFDMVVTARAGDAGRSVLSRMADHFDYVLVLDESDRPMGWIHQRSIVAEKPINAIDAHPSSPVLDRRTTLKDALSLLLEADVQAGVVLDRAGTLLGVLTIGGIANWIRGQDPAVGDPVTTR
jgi:osmoprotectant transport system ATP-binding protein